jgi:hypothetical protein
MDKFEKATAVYVLLFVAIGVVRSFYPSAVLGFIITHLVYLKFAMDDVTERNASRLWLPSFGLLGLLAALPYLYVRR